MPVGVTVSRRAHAERDFYFLQNFTPERKTVDPAGLKFLDMEDDKEVSGSVEIAPWGVRVLELL